MAEERARAAPTASNSEQHPLPAPGREHDAERASTSSAAASSRTVSRWCWFGISSSRSAPWTRAARGARRSRRCRSQSFHPGRRAGAGRAGAPSSAWRDSLGAVWRARARSCVTHGRMRITTDDGVGLAVEVAGSGSGPAARARVRRRQGRLRRPRARARASTTRSSSSTTAATARATSRTIRPPIAAAYSFERLATDIVEVADALGLDRFRLLGHSMGGMVGAPDGAATRRNGSTRSS